EVRDSILLEDIPPDQAIRVITKNPADILKLPHKGAIEAGRDADLVMLDPDDYQIDTVIALGRTMVEGGQAIVKGTFE
ncbi:beta-aspartyl-peptidase, partial [Exiguobacterium sp. SH3S2]|uniref:amidohydrolase family protein n=1 Tax=Exiguobacterium sp. SH3S2 TaxID=2510956 RepID=UPI0010D02DAF